MFDTDALTVFLNGVSVTNWAMTAAFTDGYADAATILFDTALASGDVIIIDGDMAADRQEDYMNGPGLTASMNVEQARHVVGISEAKRDTKRSLRFLKDIDPIKPVPGTAFTFDEDGNFVLDPSSKASMEAAQKAAEEAEAAAIALRGGSRAAFVILNATGVFDALADGSTIMIEGLSYVRKAGATAISDLAGWVPGAIHGIIYLACFGDIVFDSMAASATNTAIIHSAWAYMGSNPGALVYPQGVIYVSDTDADTYALLMTISNVTHIGFGTTLKNTDPLTSLMRIGPQTITVSGNGRLWTEKNEWHGFTFDQGLKVQYISNPSGESGNASGWSAVGDGVIASVFDNLGRRLQATVSGVAGSGAAYAMATASGQAYYANIQLMQAAPAGTYLCASKSTSIADAIGTPIDLSAITDSLLRCSFTFTASGAATYFLIVQSGSPVAGAVNFKNAYCWPQYAEAQWEGVALACAGMQRSKFIGCTLKNSGHYLMALQNGGYIDNTVDDCTFMDNMMDAIDCKNNGSIDRGNIVSKSRFYRNSLKMDVGGGQSATVDLSEGWQVSDLYFENIGYNVGYAGALRFKTGEINDASGRGEGGRRNGASNIKVEIVGVPVSGAFGFMAQNRLNTVSDLVVRGADIGADILGQGTAIVGAIITDVNTGIWLRNKAAGTNTPSDVGRDSSIHGAMIRANVTGILSQVTNASLHGVSVESLVTGISMSAGTISWFGGKIDAPTKVGGTGGILHMVDVYGWDNQTQQITATQDVTVVGVYDLIIAHSLPSIPSVSSLICGVRTTDAQCQASVYSITSTNITVRLRVFAAGTGTATVYVQYVNQRRSIP